MAEEKSLKEFEERIYEYCDSHVGNKILFTGFESLWPKNEQMTTPIPKDLANLTGIIMKNLIDQRVLIEVKKEFECVYGMYKILPHERLIKK